MLGISSCENPGILLPFLGSRFLSVKNPQSNLDLVCLEESQRKKFSCQYSILKNFNAREKKVFKKKCTR
jgi:hypothetical protein